MLYGIVYNDVSSRTSVTSSFLRLLSVFVRWLNGVLVRRTTQCFLLGLNFFQLELDFVQLVSNFFPNTSYHHLNIAQYIQEHFLHIINPARSADITDAIHDL